MLLHPTPRLIRMNDKSPWTQIEVSSFIQWVGPLPFWNIQILNHCILDPKFNKEALQENLRELLVSLFRKRQRLSYFQVRERNHSRQTNSLTQLKGYHDIATVVFLTMPEELQLPCIEKLSLHRLRDSMGAGLEPVLGLLRYGPSRSSSSWTQQYDLIAEWQKNWFDCETEPTQTSLNGNSLIAFEAVNISWIHRPGTHHSPFMPSRTSWLSSPMTCPHFLWFSTSSTTSYADPQ